MKRTRILFTLSILALPLAAVSASPTAEDLISDLRSDEVWYNAERASRTILQLDDPPAKQLYEALDSDDWQQRQMACEVIWALRTWRARPSKEGWYAKFPVTDRLVGVTIEGLRSDTLPLDREGNYNFVFNAANAIRCLPSVAHDYRDKLEAGLESDDYQMKLGCALILSHGGVTESVALVAPILIPHLRDNDIPEDAKFAVYGLYRLGEGVIPHLEEALAKADRQQAELISLLILNFEEPPQNQRDIENRKKLHSITEVVFDPSLEMTHDEFWWLWRLPRSQWLADRGEIPQPKPRPDR